MSINRRVDDWLLGYERSVKTRKAGLGGGGRTKGLQLKSGFGIKNLSAAAAKKPEVTVKIPRRSGSSNGFTGIANHVDYISRNGKVPITDKDGNVYTNKKDIHEYLSSWKNTGIPKESNKREALNIVFSMPAGTPPNAVHQAVKHWAKDMFDDHQYVMALHTDEPHPHVHLCVTMRNELGQRLNPRKDDLFKWRLLFAEKMREQGVECAATKRIHRGQYQKAKNSTVQHIKKRGGQSYVDRQKVNDMLEAIKQNKRPIHPFLKEQLNTKQLVLAEYKSLSKALYQEGLKTEAKAISKLANELANKTPKTKAQQDYDNQATERDLSI